MPSAADTMIGAAALGSTWRKIRRVGPAPTARAAATNSRSRRPSTSARTSRLVPNHPVSPMSSTSTGSGRRPHSATALSSTNMRGMASPTPTPPLSPASNPPPKYPAAAPPASPRGAAPPLPRAAPRRPRPRTRATSRRSPRRAAHANAGIGDGVQHVRHEAAQDHDPARHERRPGDEGVITLKDRRDRQSAHARPGEDSLHEHGAGEQEREGETEQGDEGEQGVAERVHQQDATLA